jgi:hypothetical protein
MKPEEMVPGLRVQVYPDGDEGEIIRVSDFPPVKGMKVAMIRMDKGGYLKRSHKDLRALAPTDLEPDPEPDVNDPTEREQLMNDIKSFLSTEERHKLADLIQEAVDEGLMDKLRGAVGLKPKEEFKVIPKEQWVALMKDSRQLVDMLANTPGVRDAADLVTDVLEQLAERGSKEAKKLQQGIKMALKKKDKQALVNVIRGMQKEADKIRTVRGQRLKGVRGNIGDDIQRIASVISEDIRDNNGLLRE